MTTPVVVESPGRRTHRRHGAAFKAQVIRASRQPGVSMASVALANGLNARMLRRWLVEADRIRAVVVGRQGAVCVNDAPAARSLAAFVAVQMPTAPAAPTQPDVRIELKRGATTIVIRWPAALAGAFATCLREMLR